MAEKEVVKKGNTENTKTRRKSHITYQTKPKKTGSKKKHSEVGIKMQEMDNIWKAIEKIQNYCRDRKRKKLQLGEKN